MFSVSPTLGGLDECAEVKEEEEAKEEGLFPTGAAEIDSYTKGRLCLLTRDYMEKEKSARSSTRELKIDAALFVGAEMSISIYAIFASDYHP